MTRHSHCRFTRALGASEMRGGQSWFLKSTAFQLSLSSGSGIFSQSEAVSAGLLGKAGQNGSRAPRSPTLPQIICVHVMYFPKLLSGFSILGYCRNMSEQHGGSP